MCTWDGKQMMGMVAIMTELTSFQKTVPPPVGPITTLQHKIIKCDCQPLAAPANGVLVQIIGDMCVNGNQANLLKFSHVRACATLLLLRAPARALRPRASCGLPRVLSLVRAVLADVRAAAHNDGELVHCQRDLPHVGKHDHQSAQPSR